MISNLSTNHSQNKFQNSSLITTPSFPIHTQHHSSWMQITNKRARSLVIGMGRKGNRGDIALHLYHIPFSALQARNQSRVLS